MNNLVIEIALVLAIGFAAIALVRLSRTRHAAKFGAQPPGTKMKTLFSFVVWAAVYAIIGWWSCSALVLVLIALLAFSHIFGFRDQPWSNWQPVRDGGIIASLIAAPTLLFVLGGTSG